MHLKTRLDQVPGVKASKVTGFVTFRLSSKKNPEMDTNYQHPGYVDLFTFMRAVAWIGKEATFKISDKMVEVLDGRNFYTLKFN